MILMNHQLNFQIEHAFTRASVNSLPGYLKLSLKLIQKIPTYLNVVSLQIFKMKGTSWITIIPT